MAKTIQLALLEHARDLAGGVSYLARSLGVGVNALDAMLHGHDPIPSWVFVKAVDFVEEQNQTGAIPPGFPPNWREYLPR